MSPDLGQATPFRSGPYAGLEGVRWRRAMTIVSLTLGGHMSPHIDPDPRERIASARDASADARNTAADQRDDTANERDVAADLRDVHADDREDSVAEREVSLDALIAAVVNSIPNVA